MDCSLDDSKVWFFNSLRKDPLVQKLGVEQRIRGITEMLLEYVCLANHATIEFVRANKPIAQVHLDTIVDTANKCDCGQTKAMASAIVSKYAKVIAQRERPMSVDFRDVRDIAYTVGTYVDERPFLERLRHFFLPENRMHPRILDFSAMYHLLKEKGTFNIHDLDSEVKSQIDSLLNRELSVETRVDAVSQMLHGSVDYVNRQCELARLYSVYDIMQAHRLSDAWVDLRKGRQIFTEGLSSRAIEECAEYFARQSAVNGLTFRSLMLLCFRVTGQDEPETMVDEIHSQLMETYEEHGKVEVDFEM